MSESDAEKLARPHGSLYSAHVHVMVTPEQMGRIKEMAAPEASQASWLRDVLDREWLFHRRRLRNKQRRIDRKAARALLARQIADTQSFAERMGRAQDAWEQGRC